MKLLRALFIVLGVIVLSITVGFGVYYIIVLF
jgi:hypothetical protein